MRIKKNFSVGWILLLAISVILLISPKDIATAQTPETPYAGINWMISAMDGSHQPYGVFIPTPSDKDTPRPILFIGHGAGGRAGVPSATSNPQKWVLRLT